MRLKRLELRGFKTFAQPAEFLFDADFTAVVGPNGSGKSNVADALRWALGEQSMRNLRSKKTEDVIFTGSSSRPPLGMAQVALTLDNASGRLPMPYEEVTLTRRAFRSGENEYVLNGTRVRLRDMGDLLLRAGLGNGSYTIIGQGLVDQALSLRPEERREMFEEAADVKRYWVSIRETAERVAAAETNAERVRDLLAEIEPRVRSLRRQADQARQHETLQREQTANLAAAYLVERARLRAEASALESRLAELAVTVDAVQAELTAAEQAEAALETRRAEQERALEGARAEAEAARRGLEAARAAATLAEERRRAADAAARAGAAECARLEEASRRAGDWLAEQAARRAALELARGEAEAAVSPAEAELGERRAAARAATAALDRTRSAAAALAADLSAARARQAQFEERIREREREAAVARAAAAAADPAHLAALDARLAERRSAADRLGARVVELDSRLKSGRVEAAAMEERRVSLAEVAARLAREREAAVGRLELLERAHETGAGLYPGVRSVMLAAGKPGGLGGVVGTVSSIIRVPAELETAVEVALGGHLQDVVVEGWRDAEAAVERLKATRGGRATFLPLDTIRASRLPAPEPGPGIHGVAADLVEAAPRLRPVVDHLLARTLIVDDLPTARRALQRVGAAWQIVTLSGELVRGSGAITGGSRAADTHVLGRERELRELPGRVADLTERQRATQSDLTRLAEAAKGLRDDLQAAEAEWRAGLGAQQRLSIELANATAEREAAEAAARAQVAILEQSDRAVAELRERHAGLAAETADLLAAHAAAAAALKEATAADATARTAERAAADMLQQARARVASLRQQAENLMAGAARAEREATEAGARLAARRAESPALETALAEREAELAAARAALPAAEERSAAAASALAPARAALDQLGRDRHATRSRQAGVATRLREAEAARAAAESTLRFARGERDALEAALVADVPQLDGVDDPRPVLQTLAGDRALPEEGRARRQLESARAKLRGLGQIDLDVVREYEEVSQRREFLVAQLEDLRRGADSLRTAMDDLREVGRQRFSTAFEAIAEAFGRHFTALFGGGRAHLTLTDPTDPAATGIDIVAQPPGKRAQPLSLLSGGERALTASALIFAMLTVNPIPFCVLDEVDAALDEANVRRFLDVLRGLSSTTQFILITHNRATMEAAGALYGVTMGRDGSSQVISLRVDDIGAPGSGARAS